MRGVFKAGAAVALIALLIAPAVYADDPPQNRIAPPIGITAPNDEPQVRILPPIGVTAQEERSTFFELFWLWLAVRGIPPIG